MVSERWCLVLGLLASSVAVACSADDSAGSLSGGPSPGLGSGGGFNGSAPGGAGAPVVSIPGDSGAPLPPEMELDQSFRAPVATGRVLWSANPDSGRVALIDAKTLAVRMTNAGFGPTYLAAVPSAPGTDSALVLNVGSHDATWFKADATQISALTLPTHVGANAWSISADGQYAIAWSDVSRLDGGAPDPVEGYSELTVLDLSADPPTSTRLSVGFRPSQVVFDAAAKHTYAVVDEGISVLDLGETPALARLLTVSDSSAAAHARDVNIAPDGSFAVVRVEGSANVEIIDLASDVRQVVGLGSSVTDLDLSADGTSATAVLGNEAAPEVIRFPVPDPGDPSAFVHAAITGELVRSVTLAPDGNLALLYANAVPSSHLTLLETQHFGYRTVDLQGAVQSVFVSPDSSAAITFQTPPLGSMKKGLFSIVPTGAVRAPRVVATDALPADLAFSAAAQGKALLTVHDSHSTVHGVYVIGLANLEQSFIALSSEPLPGATGIVAEAHRGFVAQKQPEGRITFIDLDTGAAQTLSGFEIAARIVQ